MRNHFQWKRKKLYSEMTFIIFFFLVKCWTINIGMTIGILCNILHCFSWNILCYSVFEGNCVSSLFRIMYMCVCGVVCIELWNILPRSGSKFFTIFTLFCQWQKTRSMAQRQTRMKMNPFFVKMYINIILLFDENSRCFFNRTQKQFYLVLCKRNIAWKPNKKII